MTTINKTFLTTALTAASLAAVPALTSADHYRMTPQLTKLGDVGTHAADAEDFIPVPGQRFDPVAVPTPMPRDGLLVRVRPV